MSNIAISVRNVSKYYRIFDNQRSRLLHAIWPGYRFGMQEICALKNIDLEIRRGEAVAIIGRNGGGKSTLLEILTGTLTPTCGDVEIYGRISALLELGSGFNPEYTGWDNVMLNGLLLGLSRNEILSRFDEVAAFAEIGDSMYRPVKTYSSGMMMRLAFSVQILLRPEILIVDEALGVGDFFFQQKCFARLRQMRDEGLTLLFVSHDMGIVRDLCQRALYLRSGIPQFFGDTATAIRLYMSESQSPVRTMLADSLQPLPLLFEQLAVDAIWSRRPEGGRLMAVHIHDMSGCAIGQAKLGETVRIQACYRTMAEGESLTISLAIKNRYDQIVTFANSARLGIDSIKGAREHYAIFEFELDLMLEAGLYSLRISIGARPAEHNRGQQIDTTDWFGPFQIYWDYENQSAPFLGMFGLPIRGRLK